jgi:hypothetical protein
MRWLFHDPNDRREAASRKRILDRIADWWDQFESKSTAIGDLFRGKRKWDLPAWMHDTLQAIDSHLMWEFGPAVRGDGHRLVITPESQTHLRPLVRAILDRAPDLSGGEFYEYRLAEDLGQAKLAVEGRTGGTIDDVVVEVRAGETNRINLLYRSPDTQDEDDRTALEIALVATETLLGEKALDRWVGAIEVAPLAGAAKKGRAIPLARLKDTFNAVIASIRDDLPDVPYAEREDQDKWTLLELQPKEADDYSDQDDLIVATTCDVELWKATHGPAPFYSQRFSRCKETFVYIKMDGSNRRSGSEAEDRGVIEDAVDEAIGTEGYGIHIGGGTGLRYSYIDVALTDLDRGVERIRRALRKERVPEESWILFYDADLATEWVGVHPETPPPP